MSQSVLLITVDSLRTDFLSSYADGPRAKQRFNNKIVNGTRFKNAFATGPGTAPSFPALLTGTRPLSYGGLGPLADERPRVAKQFQSQEFTTASRQCNPFLSSNFGYDEGFDDFCDYQNPLMGVATKIFPRGIELNNPRLKSLDETLHITNLIKKTYQLIKGKPRPYVSADVITEDTINWLEDVQGPFFCWTHFMDVHHPCFPPVEHRERYAVADISQSTVSEWYSALLREPQLLENEELENLRRLYEAAIDYTGDCVNEIIRNLERAGRLEETIIIVTSDHGELFGEHGQYGKPERMYDELLRVPLFVVNGPDYLGSEVKELTSLLDIPPLMHDAVDIQIPPQYEGQIPIKGESRDYVLAEHEVNGSVVVGSRSGEWLYEVDEIIGERRMFDLGKGFEPVNPEHEEGAVVQEAVHRRLNELKVNGGYLKADVEADVEDRLEDLGYL